MTAISDQAALLVQAIDGLGPAIKNRPINQPAMKIELGNSAQANGGRGIDKGSYFQVDMSIGQTLLNGLTATNNADGTVTLPAGHYEVTGTIKIVANPAGQFDLPPQLTLATGNSPYSFPGVYQTDVQYLPQAKISSTTSGSSFGTMAISGIIDLAATDSLWLRFSKIADAGNAANFLSLQGYLNYIKL
jgi:hypothetical protein